MNSKQLKVLGYVVIGLMVLNLVLFAFTVINWVMFLVILALGYVFVKWGLPRLRKV